MEKIICLDGYTLNPGDLDWKAFERLGSLEVHDRTPNKEIIHCAQKATVLLTNKTPITAKTIALCPQLKYIGVLATGYNVVDIGAATQRGILVSNVPNYSTDSVAQHTIALLLDLARQAHAHHLAVKKGDWVQAPDFCFTVSPIRSLENLRMGFIGLGRIGGRTARIAHSIGLHVQAHTRSQTRTKELGDTPVNFVALEELIRTSDIISLHCPLTEKTDQLINAERIAQMKPDAYIINTSRGQLIDHAAIAQALKQGRLGGLAVDVLETEPPLAEHPLLDCPNCIITPHVAWAALTSRKSLMEQAAENLKQFLEGTPINTIP